MTLWAWSLRSWSTPGVEQACLALQDRANQSVALLLWRAWCVAERRPVDVECLRAAKGLAEPIEIEVLRPLRCARRSLSSVRPGLDDRLRQGALKQVRSAEMDIERALLEALEALSTEPADNESNLPEALQSLFQDCSEPAMETPVRDLVKTLARSLSSAVA